MTHHDTSRPPQDRSFPREFAKRTLAVLLSSVRIHVEHLTLVNDIPQASSGSRSVVCGATDDDQVMHSGPEKLQQLLISCEVGCGMGGVLPVAEGALIPVRMGWGLQGGQASTSTG